MAFAKLLFSGSVVFSVAVAAYGQKGAAVSSIPVSPNPRAFVQALPKQKHSRGMCARAVRMAVEKLTGRKLERRDYAKEYGVPLLKTGCYRRISANVVPKNYDVRILLPRKRSHYGHIEVFYQGHWYSDFRQPGSLWNVWPKEYAGIQHYRFVGQTSPQPTERRAIPVQHVSRTGARRANLRTAGAALASPVF
ncbi:exported protein of unknown function [Methylacidimicrobium sp. AP8]|uniref:hypothetical protein n=1 Tax=Methylacidimicrobium sp. AP8 TaxID=2730359 RepID=UPI0018C1107A|nr:hypothetical protein [Methylacidimicrobium sp. AP8]CAB4243461.1 exported protein of unknown function [Methylacidimicrobium sp. AP8]